MTTQKGDVEIAASGSINSQVFPQADVQVTATPLNRFFVTGIASYAQLKQKSRAVDYGFNSLGLVYNNVNFTTKRVGLGLGIFKKQAFGYSYAQGGVNYERVNTGLEKGRDPERLPFDPNSNELVERELTQVEFVTPWQQMALRFDLEKSPSSSPQVSLVLSITAHELIRRSIKIEDAFVSGNINEWRPDNNREHLPGPIMLMIGAHAGANVLFKSGLGINFTASLANRRAPEKQFLSYSSSYQSLGCIYSFGKGKQKPPTPQSP